MTENLRRFIRKLYLDSFLRTSSLAFIANISIALINNIIVLIVGNYLPFEYLASWTALNGLIQIMLSPFSGINTHFIRRFSTLSHESESKALSFFQEIKKKTIPFVIGGVILSPVIALIFHYSFFNTLPIIALTFVFIYLFIQFEATQSNNYLMGTLRMKEYLITHVVSNIIKLPTSIVLFVSGVTLLTLPLGLIFQTVCIYIISYIYIKKIRLSTEIRINTSIDIKHEVLGVVKTCLSLTLLSLIINIGSVISQRFLIEGDRDLYAVFVNLGLIIFFGANAPLTAIVAQAARVKNSSVYLKSLGVYLVFTVGIVGMLALFKDFVFSIFKRSQYSEQLSLFVFYSLFILFYGFIFTSIQYLISQNRYGPIYTTIFISIIMAIFLVLVGAYQITLFSGSVLITFIGISVVFSGLCSLFLMNSILRYKPSVQ